MGNSERVRAFELHETFDRAIPSHLYDYSGVLSRMRIYRPASSCPFYACALPCGANEGLGWVYRSVVVALNATPTPTDMAVAGALRMLWRGSLARGPAGEFPHLLGKYGRRQAVVAASESSAWCWSQPA